MKIIDTVKSFLPKAFIGIVLEESACKVNVRIMKKGSLRKEEKKEFKAYGHEMPIEAINFIAKYQKSYRFCYVSAVLSSINQGALSTCKRGEFAQYHVEAENVEAVCMNESWSVYSYADDIAWARRMYEKSGGIDFIFSPFAILYEIIRPGLDETHRLYILSQNSSVTLAVMNEEKLFYGAYFLLAPDERIEEEEGDETSGNEEEGDDSGDITDEIEELDSIDGIEDIDGLSELEDLENEVKLDDFDELDEGTDESPKGGGESLDQLGKGLDILEFIKESVEKYYKSDQYESMFIEDIIFLDDSDLEKELIEYVQDSLLLNVTKEDANIVDTVCDLAIDEVESL